jgi:hypothetical protein
VLTDAEGNIGDAIHLVDQASKGSSGRVIPLNKELKAALEQIQKAQVGAGRRPSWGLVALAVARQIGSREDVDPRVRLAMNAVLVPDRDNAASPKPRSFFD